ncbi:hypothetical protein [Allopusillimonas ginsengisoli]|uniref:hypothetical protein n=1 Tax=Allopusillimonas ginsengisoli TaxID=453575 RepID=UPI00101FB72E|nr:hypothetical protein [Allopusillimonas ginsengisoli]TEA70388.1 hypothetical protein ERE07_20670 [Allopusillimonas ginsengisoli]
MKHFLWFLIMFCGVSVAEDRHAASGTAVESASNTSSLMCAKEDAFEVGQAGGFADTPSYTDRLFASDGKSSWQGFHYSPVVPGCFVAPEGMVWESSNHLWLDSMRPAPSYPSANNPAAFLSSGWRWIEDVER